MSLKESWNSLSAMGKTTAIVTVVGGGLTLLTQISPAVSALDDLGMPVLATRQWARDQNVQLKSTMSALTNKLNDLQLDTLNGKIEGATSARNKMEIDALNYDATGKVKAAQEIRRIDDNIGAYNEQRRAIIGNRRPQ